MRNELVGMWRRMAALVIDGIMLILASIPLSLIIREMTLSQVAIWLLLLGIMIIYSTVFITRRGQTPGKVMMMLRVISEKGGAVTQRQALIRSAVKWVPVFSVFILLATVSTPPPNPQDYLRPDGGLVPKSWHYLAYGQLGGKVPNG